VKPGRTRSTLLRLHAALVYVFLYAPIAVLVLYSFNRSVQTAAWKGFTTHWYSAAVNSQDLTEAARNSVLVAATTTALACVVGTMAALGLHRLGSRRGGATRGLLFLPIIIPEIVIGAAMLTFILSPTSRSPSPTSRSSSAPAWPASIRPSKRPPGTWGRPPPASSGGSSSRSCSPASSPRRCSSLHCPSTTM
jgi:ABC-type spermidine/putrescine transport system permease subunit II